MSSATVTTIEERVAAFVSAVGEHFSDLPEPERDELLADLEQHLSELAADAPDVLDAEMGDPAGYAAELRAGAGLEERLPRPSRWRRIDLAVRDRVRAVLDHPRMDPVHEFLPMLRPAWWIVRAWAPLVVLGTVVDAGSNWAGNLIVPGRNVLGLAVLLAAVVYSVRAGMRGDDNGRWWRLVSIVGALSAVVVLWSAAFVSPRQTVFVETYVGDTFEPQIGVLTHPDGEGITNLYVYDDEGNLLQDVFIFDGVGRPVAVGPNADEWYGIESDVRVDADGRVLDNLYPLRQYVYDAEGNLVVRDVPPVTVPPLPEAREPGATSVEEPPTTTLAPEPPAKEEPAEELSDPTRPASRFKLE